MFEGAIIDGLGAIAAVVIPFVFGGMVNDQKVNNDARAAFVTKFGENTRITCSISNPNGDLVQIAATAAHAVAQLEKIGIRGAKLAGADCSKAAP